MPKPTTPRTWIELSLDRAGDEIRARAHTSRGEQTAPFSLGADQAATAALRFAASVERASARGGAFPPALVAEAQALQGKVIAKAVPPRMVQRHNLSAHGVGPAGFVVLVRVAARACEREVVGVGRSAGAPRHDVVDRERRHREPDLAPAVLAAPPRALADLSSLLGRDARLTHRSAAGCRDHPSGP
jgi:hypothetical protein